MNNTPMLFAYSEPRLVDIALIVLTSAPAGTVLTYLPAKSLGKVVLTHPKARDDAVIPIKQP